MTAPMTLGNMRANGVRSLLVNCSSVSCRRESILNVDGLSNDVFVPSLGPRMRCQRCGQRGAPKGNLNAFKHGRYTAKAVTGRREIAKLFRALRTLAGEEVKTE